MLEVVEAATLRTDDELGEVDASDERGKAETAVDMIPSNSYHSHLYCLLYTQQESLVARLVIVGCDNFRPLATLLLPIVVAAVVLKLLLEYPGSEQLPSSSLYFHHDHQSCAFDVCVLASSGSW